MNGAEPIPKPPEPARKRRRRSLAFWRRGRDAPLVSVLRLAGIVGRVGSLRGGSVTLASMERAIDRAFAPRRLAAVALAVNSPGGSPVQSALIARRIRARADERGVPVLAFAEDVAASGGYWLACAGDEIFADENSIVGSIGVIAAGFGFVEAIARHGVERRVHTAGARKGMLDPFRPEDPGEVERLLAVQRDMHESFIAHVRQRRGRRLKGADEELFSGEFWSGRQAIALGLVDGLGDLRGVLRDRFGERVRIRPVAPRRGLRRRLGIGPAGGGIDAGALGAELLAALDEWAMWKRYGL
ncbi:MAG: S49 family peptidase [Defluviicoccus sp.]|nr:S49 family peptidase [Defluviicoccus sp.]MDE0386305.1 S49 family peptidase [Defluviicoccus sp.]